LILWRRALRNPVVLFHASKTCNIRYKSPLTKQIKTMSLDKMIDLACPSLTHKGKNVFFAHPFLLNGHLQTVWASVFASHFGKKRVQFERELINTPDGGVVALDWTKRPTTSKRVPLVFICHGLTGGSHETYVQDFVLAAKEYGYESVVMNFRGCSETPVESPQLYSGSWTADVELSVKHIQERIPGVVLFGIGFSLGSNVITKFAGQMGENVS
jgi:predicted alpha/beta-fold hydrolase